MSMPTPLHVRVLTRCPHCGETSDADSEFVDLMRSSGALDQVTARVMEYRSSQSRWKRLRGALAVAFAAVAATSVLFAGALWLHPMPVDTADLIVSHMITSLMAYCAAYLAWGWR